MCALITQFVILTYFLIQLIFVHSGFTTTKLGPKPIWNSTHTDKLRQDLLLNYDKFARPAQHYNTTHVSLGISIHHLEMNELKSTLTVYCWLQLGWKDEKLKWNSSDYGGLTSVHLAEHEIWQPDIFLYNSATSTAINHYANTHCIAYENGDILWVPPNQFTVLCSLNMKYWPFDVQHCQMKFGSWTYDGDQISMGLLNNRTEVEMELLVTNAEWEFTKGTLETNLKYYSCCSEPYPDVTINITLTRISPSYKTIIITPAFAIITLTLLGFWLPPQSGEKILVNGCTTIIVCLLLLYFTQKLPAMGTHTPLIVLFYSNSLYMITFSMIESVLVIWMSRTKHCSPVPWFIKDLLTGKARNILGLNSYINQSSLSTRRSTAEEMRDHQVTDFDDHTGGDDHQILSSSNKPSINQDWILVAAAIDRLSFIFYGFLFTILSIAYSI